MSAKLIAMLIVLSALLAPTYATVSFAQTNTTATQTTSSSAPSINPSVLGAVINATINGIQTALSHVPQNSTAYKVLSTALSYLKQAQAYYNKGNYAEALQYLKMAMNESYNGVVSVGKPFVVPYGTNVSTEQAIEYAQKLESEANFITNSTLKAQVMSEIQQALNELKAGNFTEAREMLGNINAQIHHYVKGRFAVNFEQKFVPKVMKKFEKLESKLEKELNETAQPLAPLMKEFNVSPQDFMAQFNASIQNFNLSVMQIAQNFENESGWQIAQQVNALNNFNHFNFSTTLTAPKWEIGVYKNEVYIEMPYVLPVISIGNSTYFVAWNHHPVKPKPEAPIQPFWANGTPSAPPFNGSEWIVVGVVNSSSAVSYVLSHVGQNITIFPPNVSMSMRGNGFNVSMNVQFPFKNTAEDVGNFSSATTGIFTVYYEPITEMPFASFQLTF